MVHGDLRYVGICDDLRERWGPRGYGAIHRAGPGLVGLRRQPSPGTSPPGSPHPQPSDFAPRRSNTRQVTGNRLGPFAKNHAYEGWHRGLYALDWFDSEPERALANLVDDDKAVEVWVRLHTNELPSVWAADGRQYSADFIVVETSGDHWIVEVKADNQAATEGVQAKRLAAKRWTNIVNILPFKDGRCQPGGSAAASRRTICHPCWLTNWGSVSQGMHIASQTSGMRGIVTLRGVS